jgi:16S rRNA (uracil1498-N3)-methyltransferase
MHRFYLAPDLAQGPTLTLTGSEAHHARRVLRLQPGERVIVLDGAGIEVLCEVRDLRPAGVTLAALQREVVPPMPCRITLVQAVPKGKTFDAIVQKATELGVSRIVPLLTERVNVRLTSDHSGKKADKWRLTAIEAIKQCGCAWLPSIQEPMALRDYLECGEKVDLALLASLQGDGRHPREWLDGFRAEHQALPESVALWIGPEGDFTSTEVKAILASGARPITLGRWILRSETAAIYCLSFLNYELHAPRPDGVR